jgi:hypothetical protein
MKKHSSILIILSFALMFSPLANAAPNTYLNEVSCRIDFNVAVMNSMISASANGSSLLQPSVTALTNDKAQIQSLQNPADINSFKSQYASDMKQARASVSQWRTAVRKGLPLATKASLASSYNTAKSAYEQCSFSVEQAMAQNRIANYQAQISKFQNVSNQLASRGFDTTQLNQILGSGQTGIIQPLQSAISSANDSQSLGNALRSYCLYDGCANGTNFHIDAKFDIAKYSTVLVSLQNVSSSFNLNSTALAQAAQSLTDAQATLNQVGTSVYTGSQSQTIFGDIKVAARDISQLINQINKQSSGGLK